MGNIFESMDNIKDDLFETLSNALRPRVHYLNQLPSGIRNFALIKYKEVMDQLYHPDLYVLPISPEGEAELERLYAEDNYGAYKKNFVYQGETYLAIIVNND